MDRLAEPSGIRLEVGEHLRRGGLGHDDDRGRPGVRGEGRERLPRRAGSDGRRQVTTTDAEAVADPDPCRVEQAHDLLGTGAGGGHDADGPLAHDVGEAHRDPADDRGAAVGPHDEHVRGGRGVLEPHLVLDRDVVGEDHDRDAGPHRVEGLGDGILPRHRDEREVGARESDAPPSVRAAGAAPSPAGAAAAERLWVRAPSSADWPAARPDASPRIAMMRSLGDDAGTSKPIPRMTSRLSSVAIATWAASTPGAAATVRETCMRVTESR